MLKANVVRYVSRETKDEIRAGHHVTTWVLVARTDRHPERESFVVSTDKGINFPPSFMQGADTPLETIAALLHHNIIFGEVEALEGSPLDTDRNTTDLPFTGVSVKLTDEEKAERAAKIARKAQLKKTGRLTWHDACMLSMKGDPRRLDTFIPAARGRYGN